MATQKQCTGINIFSSQQQYEDNLENIKDTDINLIKDPEIYVTKAEFDELKAIVEALKIQIEK